MIEGIGVPHAEVDLILVNGESSDFTRLIRNGDRVAVYPVFESIDITPVLRLRPQPLRETKFVLDVHLGRLAGYLRMLGFDAVYSNCASDLELVRISSQQRRILLARDRGVLKHSAVTHGYWLRETDSRRQAAEIVRRFDLAQALRPLTRCMSTSRSKQPQGPRFAAGFRKELWNGAMNSGSARAVGKCIGTARTVGGWIAGLSNWLLPLGRLSSDQKLQVQPRYSTRHPPDTTKGG